MSLKTSDSLESFKSKTSLIKHFKRRSESGSDLASIVSGSADCSTVNQATSTKKSSDHIKRIIRDFKKLDHGLVKFESKGNGILKTNILRVTLLPFLRTNFNDSLMYCSFNKTISQTAITCLIKWWTSLLASLQTTTGTPVSSSDRAVYLECISRIITRKEWKLSTTSYQKLLTETLEFSISRLNLKTVSLSTSAFVGKVFAYSFFHLPDVSTLLLFLLGVKQISVENLSKQIFILNNQANSFTSIQDALKRINHLFPPHVKHIVGYNGKYRVPRSEKKYLNAMIAPVRPVRGIADPRGSWVKRWCSFDSDVFCSFLRHYLHIASDFLVENADDSTNLNSLPLNALAALPGFMIIWSHIYETINDSVMQRCKKSVQKEKDYNISIFNALDPVQKMNKLIDSTTNISVNVMKILKTIRDFLHNSYNENEMMISPFVVHLFDQVLQCYACKISAYNWEVTGYLLDIAYEYMVNTVRRTRESNSSMLLIISLDWNFWICALQNMLQTSNINCELKSLAILFNIWDLLPSFNHIHSYKKFPKWFTNEQESIKWNATIWLISFPIFDKYFCHWQPLVRSYYQRLICWRLIVFTNSEILEQQESVRRVIENRLYSIFETMNGLVLDCNMKNAKLPEMSLSTPMANRKIVINRVVQSNEFFISDNLQSEMLTIATDNATRRIHSYEIFDDAIYCSSSSSASTTVLESNKSKKRVTSSTSQIIPEVLETKLSIVGSALKFFKKPTAITEQETSLSPSPPPSLSSSSRLSAMLTPPSGISKTFSSLSLSSRSSSPSLMSSSNNASPPSSSTSDLSDMDSLDFKNDLESSTDEEFENVNPPLPPELDKRAPEIVRPLYRFQLVFNESCLQKQMQVIKDSKFVHKHSNNNQDDVPKSVKVPNLQKIMNKETSQYYYNSDCDDSEDDEVFQDSQEFIFIKSKLKRFEFANLNLDLIGKSINEWNLIVDELENFLDNYLSNGGDLHFIERVVPFLSVEYPNKSINAY